MKRRFFDVVMPKARAIWLWARRPPAKTMLIWGGVCVSIVGAWHFLVVAPWNAKVEALYRAALPEGIAVTTLVAQEDSIGPVTMLVAHVLPLFRESCGGAAFRLSDEMLAGLQANGLKQLEGSTRSRGFRDRQRTIDHVYEPWQRTPAPSDWTSQGWWIGLSCLEDKNLDRTAVVKAAKEPGSYFTTEHASELLIIPSMKLVVLTHSR